MRNWYSTDIPKSKYDEYVNFQIFLMAHTRMVNATHATCASVSVSQLTKPVGGETSNYIPLYGDGQSGANGIWVQCVAEDTSTTRRHGIKWTGLSHTCHSEQQSAQPWWAKLLAKSAARPMAWSYPECTSAHQPLSLKETDTVYEDLGSVLAKIFHNP
jgi:hypothetical protein